MQTVGAKISTNIPIQQMQALEPNPDAPSFKVAFACEIHVVRLEQNGAVANPGQLSRNHDLVVIGTAMPNTDGITGRLGCSLGSTPVGVAGAGMNWTSTISRANFCADAVGTLTFEKACPGGLAAIVMQLVTFV